MTIHMTANDIITALTVPLAPSGWTVPGWVARAATVVHPRRRNSRLYTSSMGYYQTTRVKFFTEVTVRVNTIKTARRSGKQYRGLQRRRIDLVALIQANKFNYKPIIAGVEIKVNEYDLANDDKMTDYLPYCNLFYLACPAELQEAAIMKRLVIGSENVGLLLAFPDHVEHVHPEPNTPSDTHLKEIYAELLVRPFRLAGKEQTISLNCETITREA